MTIKEYCRMKQVRQWQIAEVLKITETKLSRELRHDPPPERRAQLIGIINALAASGKES